MDTLETEKVEINQNIVNSLREKIKLSRGGTFLEQEKVKEKKQSLPRISKNCKSILEYWNEYSGAKQVISPEEKKNGEVTKTYRETILWVERLLQGKFQAKEIKDLDHQRFTKDEIIQAINNFVLASLNTEYLPQNKKYIQNKTLQTFIYDVFSWGNDKSCFLTYLKNPPEKIKDEIKKVDNLFPSLVKKLVEEYFNYFFLGGYEEGDEKLLSGCEKEAFVYGSYFLAQLNSSIRHQSILLSGGWVKLLFEALQRYVDIAEDQQWPNIPVVTPKWFAEKRTFSETLYRYLVSRNIIGKEKENREKFSSLLNPGDKGKKFWEDLAAKNLRF